MGELRPQQGPTNKRPRRWYSKTAQPSAGNRRAIRLRPLQLPPRNAVKREIKPEPAVFVTNLAKSGEKIRRYRQINQTPHRAEQIRQLTGELVAR